MVGYKTGKMDNLVGKQTQVSLVSYLNDLLMITSDLNCVNIVFKFTKWTPLSIINYYIKLGRII